MKMIIQANPDFFVARAFTDEAGKLTHHKVIPIIAWRLEDDETPSPITLDGDFDHAGGDPWTIILPDGKESGGQTAFDWFINLQRKYKGAE
jgi:hypothetical protein